MGVGGGEVAVQKSDPERVQACLGSREACSWRGAEGGFWGDIRKVSRAGLGKGL